MKSPKNKYRKGYAIFGESDLAHELKKGNWLYYRDKVIHPSFIGHMTFFTVMGGLKARIFNYAIDQQKEYYAKRQEEYLKTGILK